MKKRLPITVVTLASSPLIASLTAKNVSAAELAFGVYPQVTQILTAPGETETAEIVVKNLTGEPVVLTPLVQTFRASLEENGQVLYEPNVPKFLQETVVLDRGEAVTEIILAPQAEKTLSMQVSIPRDQKAQDFYYSIIFITKPESTGHDQQTESVSAYSTLSAGVASHFLLSVSPDPMRNIALKEFSTPAFSQESPIPFHVRLTNETAHFSQVNASINIQNIFGNTLEVVTIPQTTILSQSTRSLIGPTELTQLDTVKSDHSSIKRVQSYDEKPLVYQETNLFPGIYKARLQVTGPNLPAPISQTTYFMVAPIELVITIIVVLVFLYVIKKRILKRLR